MFSFDVFTILTTLIENAILFSKRIFSLPIFILLFNSSPSGEEFIVPCSMFIVNCASQSEAQPPLLPKLRGQFAEFLNNSSPVGLRILFLPTCVGLRYGRHSYIHKAFLATVQAYFSYLYFAPLRPGQPTPGLCPFNVSPYLNKWRLRNFHRMCIGYAFRPHLSSRLT